MSVQPIEVWGHYGAPNPWKVCMILERLDVPYHVLYLDLPDAKSPSFLKINPNGRLPAIKDPNTGVTLWESGAIILYLVDQYDTDSEISYRESPNKYLTQQWLAFQISGHAPSSGQAAWYARFHPEKLPSVIDRCMNEMLRVMGVLNKALEENGTGWLVGNKCTYADISFQTWAAVTQSLLHDFVKPESFENRFPAYMAWLQAMDKMEPIEKINQKIAEGLNKGGVRMV